MTVRLLSFRPLPLAQSSSWQRGECRKKVRAAGKWKNDPKTSNHKAKTLNPKTVENGGGAFKGRREIRKRGKPEDKKP